MTAIIAALAAFIITAVIGKPLIGKLQKQGLARTVSEKKGEGYVQGREAAPEFGGLLYLCGLLPAGLLGLVIWLLTSADSGFSASAETGKVLAVLVCAALTAAIGLLSDWRRARHAPPLSPLTQLLLLFGADFSFLTAIRLSGDRSSILLLPFTGGQVDLGAGWTVLMLLMLLGAACGGERMRAASGQGASVSFALSLSAGAVFAFFARENACATAFASAGAMLGILLYAFPPEKLREGSGGRMAGCVLPVMAAIAGGAPLFLLPAMIPFLFEGIYAMIKITSSALRAKDGSGLRPESFGEWLTEKGLSKKAVSGGYAVLCLAGGIAAAVGAYFYL